MPEEKTGVLENPLDRDQGDLHNQIALFLIAVYKSEHGEQPHKVNLSWMAAVILRLANQRNQTDAVDRASLERYLRSELEKQELPFGAIDTVVSWAHDRLIEVQGLSSST